MLARTTSVCATMHSWSLKGIRNDASLLTSAMFSLTIVDSIQNNRCDVKSLTIFHDILNKLTVSKLRSLEIHYQLKWSNQNGSSCQTHNEIRGTDEIPDLFDHFWKNQWNFSVPRISVENYSAKLYFQLFIKISRRCSRKWINPKIKMSEELENLKIQDSFIEKNFIL